MRKEEWSGRVRPAQSLPNVSSQQQFKTARESRSGRAVARTSRRSSLSDEEDTGKVGQFDQEWSCDGTANHYLMQMF